MTHFFSYNSLVRVSALIHTDYTEYYFWMTVKDKRSHRLSKRTFRRRISDSHRWILPYFTLIIVCLRIGSIFNICNRKFVVSNNNNVINLMSSLRQSAYSFIVLFWKNLNEITNIVCTYRSVCFLYFGLSTHGTMRDTC